MLEAYRKAYLGDPNAAMGGILAVSFGIDTGFARAVLQSLQTWGKDAGAGAFFVEVIIAAGFEDAAVEVIRTGKRWGADVRLLAVPNRHTDPPPHASELDYKGVRGGLLVQSVDSVGLNEDQWKVATKREPTDAEMTDLRLAWLVCKHTKSNAISICKDGMLIGNGAGQMSRVMSCRIATWLARENGHAAQLPGSVAASDGFFPFSDGPNVLMDAGVTAIIQPGGSKRDSDTIAACDGRNVAMILTGTRHFRH
jgi:phosphoribosylaminoimidazolecarboxamide formyltransferase/IMP cyclohydrolase